MLEDYIQALKEFDWYYEYSDDYRTYAKGRDAMVELRKLQKEFDPDFTLWREYNARL